MKKYKLLKDLPGLETGTIIEINDNGNIDINKNYYLSELEKKLLGNMIKNISGKYNGWLEEIKEEPKGIYELEKLDEGEYFYINDKGIIVKSSGLLGYSFDDRLEFGNVYLTREEAKKELEKRRAIAKIKKWIWENNIELSKDFNGYTIYGLEDGTEVGENLHCRNEFGIIFNTEQDAERCLEECKNEWEILFDLKY